MEEVKDINELIHDDHNFNRGTSLGNKLLKKSFSELGAGRSVLIDKDNRIIAGNKSHEAAQASGITKVRIIETSGDELIAVKRTDLSLDSEQGRKLALADNATASINLSWDNAQLQLVGQQIPTFNPMDYSVAPDITTLGAPSIIPNYGQSQKPKKEKRPAWGKAKDYKEPVCDMKDATMLSRRTDFFYISSFRKSEEGLPLSVIKTDEYIRTFADAALDNIRMIIQAQHTHDWSIITTPKRRHKEHNFASSVCEIISRETGITFYDNAVHAKNRHRIDPEFTLTMDIPEHNVIIYDDIVTTGSTLIATKKLLSGKNLLFIVGIKNN